MIFIPITTTQERFTGNDRIVMLSVHAHTVEEVPQAIEEVKMVLRKTHKGQDDFFSIWDMRGGMAQLDKISKVIKIALGVLQDFRYLSVALGL